jgi:hypothetical protein
LVATEDGDEAVEKEEATDEEEEDQFARGDGFGMVPEPMPARGCAFVRHTGSGGLLKISHSEVGRDKANRVPFEVD